MVYAENYENCGIKLVIDQHEDGELVEIDEPFRQLVYKKWLVIDEQTTLDNAVMAIANSASCDFVTFYGDNNFWGANEFWFVALINGTPRMFCIDKADIRFLNDVGSVTIQYIDGWDDDARQAMNEYFEEA